MYCKLRSDLNGSYNNDLEIYQKSDLYMRLWRIVNE